VPDAWRGALKRPAGRRSGPAVDLLAAERGRLVDHRSDQPDVRFAWLQPGHHRRRREPQGIVEPGRNFDALRDRIAAGLESFVDADTGEPVVARSIRPDDELAPGACSSSLPDLLVRWLVRWSNTPACRHRALRSPSLGSVRWPTPGRHPDGRSGNHRFEGILLGAGPGLRGALDLPEADISDLAPTIRALLGLAPDPTIWSGDLCSPGERSRNALTRTTSTERRARPAFPVIGFDAGFWCQAPATVPGEARRAEAPETTKSIRAVARPAGWLGGAEGSRTPDL
jgi:hypothetical protein